MNDPNGFIYYRGKYHMFYQCFPFDTRWGRMHWGHAVSEDLVHWEELPTALYPGEGDEPDASGVWTGSVIYGEGKYHAFYTGYCLTAEYQQTICHATSDDGITWVKDAANPVITPMIELYEKLDWRDPYVFYNEEDKCYWILISARRLDMPITRRGCIVLYRSKIWLTGNTTDRYIHQDTPTVLSALRCTRWETTGISHIQDFQNMETQYTE